MAGAGVLARRSRAAPKFSETGRLVSTDGALALAEPEGRPSVPGGGAP